MPPEFKVPVDLPRATRTQSVSSAGVGANFRSPVEVFLTGSVAIYQVEQAVAETADPLEAA
jgi:hypothetical protein